MEYDILYVGQAVCLVSCSVDSSGIRYGFGYYASNTPAVITLKDGNGNPVITIKTPSEAVDQGMFTAFGDEDGPNFAERAMITI